MHAVGFAVLAATALALLGSHRPDALTHPQLWAEEGSVYFKDAYEQPRLATVFTPTGGYLVVLPRLTAWAGTLLSLSIVPAVFTAVAAGVQVLPVLFLASRRMEHVIPERWRRLVLGALYLATPNSEVHANLTNVQWHLALLAGLVLVAEPPRSAGGRCFDSAVLILCGLTGPYAVLLLPIALVRFLIDGCGGWSGWMLALVAATFAVQLPVVVDSGRLSRLPHGGSTALGATPVKLLYLLADRVFIPAITGTEGNVYWNLYAGRRIVPAVIWSTIGVALTAASLLAAPAATRLFVAYCALALVVALVSPVGATTLPQWTFLLRQSGSQRYFLLPVYGFMAVVFWAVTRIPRASVRWTVGCAVLAVFLSGAVASWRYRPWAHYDLAPYERALAEAAPGSKVVVPINPPGWEMPLIKR